MKKWKLLGLVFFLFLCTGCSVTYELSYYDDSFTEVTTVGLPNSSIQNNSIYDTFDQMICEDYDCLHPLLMTYQTKTFVEGDHSYIQGTNQFLNDNYVNSLLFNMCYPNISYQRDEKYVTINSGTGFVCYDAFDKIDSIQLRFQSNHKVKSTNADEVQDGVYIWNITKENAATKTVELQVYEDVLYEQKQLQWTIGIVVGLILFGTGLYLFWRMKLRDPNKL